jgi:hypothetical protein
VFVIYDVKVMPNFREVSGIQSGIVLVQS